MEWLPGSIAQEPSRPAQPPMTMEERTKMFVDHISPKLNLTKGQKDSLNIIFIQYMDDLAKYHAENNAKVITFMMKNRDDKIKKLLRDSIKYDKYLIVMQDITKQHDMPLDTMKRKHTGSGHHNNMGNGMGGNRGF